MGTLGVLALEVKLVRDYQRSRPEWILKVDKEPGEIHIRVITTQSSDPVYQVHVRGAQFAGAPITLPDAAAETGKISGIETVFQDASMRPGRWTVRVAGLELDFWEVYLFVNGTRYEPPADVTIDMRAREDSDAASSLTTPPEAAPAH